MNLTLVFSRKCRWSEHYFSVWCLRNFTTNQFLVSKMFFTIYEYFFLQSLFNHRQRSQSNKEQCSLCCSSPCFHVLLCTHYGPLQCFSTCFRKLKEIGVLRKNKCFYPKNILMAPDCRPTHTLLYNARRQNWVYITSNKE